jgi:ParB family transcriptional regulator, chromosome partitioning protein
MARALPSLAKRFDTPVQSAQQTQTIADLQAEVERLRIAQSPDLEGELEKLRAELTQQSGEQPIAIALIDPNPEQPRQTITQESILSMARSLEKDGQIAPVILVPRGKRYLLWDGQRRYEGTKHLGRETIRAVVAAMPENLHRQALLTFIHHEDLNTLDKAEAIVREIAMASGLEESEVPTILSTVLRRLDRQKKTMQLSGLVTLPAEEQRSGLKTLELSPAEFKTLEVLLDLTLNPASVKANLVSVLSLPKDLKQAVREQGLKGAHALALATLTGKTLQIEERVATRERLEATQQVIAQDLSVRQTREMIAAIKAKYLKGNTAEEQSINLLTRAVEKLTDEALESANSEQLRLLESALKTKLAAVRKQLTQHNF